MKKSISNLANKSNRRLDQLSSSSEDPSSISNQTATPHIIRPNDLPADCLYEVFKHIEHDRQTLYSCILVNRLWCESAIESFWKNPFRFGLNSSIINTYTMCLGEDEKTSLVYEGVALPKCENGPTFNYADILQHISLKKTYAAVDLWLQRTQDSVSLTKDHDLNVLICSLLSNHFWAHCTLICSLSLDWEYIERSENHLSFFNNQRTNSRLSELRELSIHEIVDWDACRLLAHSTSNIRKLQIVDYALKDEVGEKEYEVLATLIGRQTALQHLQFFAYGQCPLPALLSIESQINSLVHVELIHWMFLPDTPENIFAGLAKCHALEILIIKNCRFPSDQILASLASASYPRLRKLWFKGLFSNEYSTFDSIVRNNSTSLRHILYEDDTNTADFDHPPLETMTDYCPHVRTLGIPYRNDHKDHLIDFLNKSTHLKSLKLYGPYGDEREFIESLFELGPLFPQTLRHLNLDVEWLTPENLTEFLGSVTAPLSIFYISGWKFFFNRDIFDTIYACIRCDKVIGDVMVEIFN